VSVLQSGPEAQVAKGRSFATRGTNGSYAQGAAVTKVRTAVHLSDVLGSTISVSPKGD